MKRDNASFLLGGIFFGFLVGFSVAYVVYRNEPKFSGVTEASMQAPVDPSDPTGAGAGSPSSAGTGPAAPDAAGSETMERVQQELSSLRQALQEDPKNTKALVRMGDLFYDAGMFDQARDYYKRSLEVEPSNPNVSTDLGVCFRRLGDSDQALQQFRKSIEMDPRHWQSWLNLGIVSLYDKRDVKTAEQAFAKVKELNPGFEGLPQLQQALNQARSGGSS